MAPRLWRYEADMRVLNHVVRRSREHEETLQKIGGKDATLFPTLREALSFCAVLGYRERRRLPLAPSQGVEDIAAGQYSMNDAVDVVFALALAEVGDADILKPERERECIFVYEEYANGGLAIVQIVSPSF